MDRIKIGKLLVPVLFIILVFGVFLFINERNENAAMVKHYRHELAQQKEINTKNKDEITKLSSQYEKIYREKNGTANSNLTNNTKKLFLSIFDYESAHEDGSVKARKAEASNFTSPKALNSLFPLDADKTTPSVTTTSRLEGDPEIYLMPSDKKELKALVLIKNSVKIADSPEQKATFMYKVSFDSTTNKFTSIQNLGEVNVS